MREFKNDYLTLLRRQIEEEIEFLVFNGHDKDKITKKCIFCIERQNKKDHCGRLGELRQFLSTIVCHQSNKLTTQFKINQAEEIHFQNIAEKYIFESKSAAHSELPLIEVKL